MSEALGALPDLGRLLGALFMWSLIIMIVGVAGGIADKVWTDLVKAWQRRKPPTPADIAALEAYSEGFEELDRAEALERALPSPAVQPNPFLPPDRWDAEAALRRTYDPTGEWDDITPVYVDKHQDLILEGNPLINSRGGMA